MIKKINIMQPFKSDKSNNRSLRVLLKDVDVNISHNNLNKKSKFLIFSWKKHTQTQCMHV